MEAELPKALITNDAVVLGLLLTILGLIFWTSGKQSGPWKTFYSYVPALLMCYFVPSLFATAGIISGERSQLYFVASRYLLPTALVLLTLNLDLPGIARLGPKALIMFFTGTIGIFAGGPIAVTIFSFIHPEVVGGEGFDAAWRGLATIAGSWTGGGANQLAMKETFHINDALFGAYVAVDVIVANVWMAVLLYWAGRAEQIDARSGADTSAITSLRDRIADYQARVARIATTTDLMVILAVGFGATALAHLGAKGLVPILEAGPRILETLSLTSSFFWLVVIATILGVALSFTPARNLEGAGASKVGSLFVYILVATVGMKMDLRALGHSTWLFAVGAIWIAFHAGLLLLVRRLIRAPIFFLAVGSQANVGGAASAPVVASAFHPALAPVGVLLAVLGYVIGSGVAWGCAHLMRLIAPA